MFGLQNVNGKFYYFNKNYSSPEFVSYDPGTASYSVLTTPALTESARQGCVNNAGTGYYCLDINANLFYYNISTNTWVTITSTFNDATSGANITTNIFKPHSSGDMAFDGQGNLWVLLSNSSNYGLYKINAPVPTSNVASITAIRYIDTTRTTPDGTTIAGIGFSSTGNIYLSSTGNKLYELLPDLTTTLKGTFSTSGVGIDLTSCNYPMGVLSVQYLSFTATQTGNSTVVLNWQVSQQVKPKSYSIELSLDNKNWESIGFIPGSNNKNVENYSFTNTNTISGMHYYRICRLETDGRKLNSETKRIDVKRNNVISLGPNPAKDYVRVQNIGNTPTKVRIVDLAGRVAKEKMLQPGISNIDISILHPGSYIVFVQRDGEYNNYKFNKE